MAVLRAAFDINDEGPYHSVLSNCSYDWFSGTDFWTTSRLTKLFQPLTSQVRRAAAFKQEHLAASYHAVISSYGRLCRESESLLKQLNASLLQATRNSPDSLVLREAVCTLTSLWTENGDALLPLVPESVPFLVELLEEQGPVAEQVSRLIAAIEEALGESLDTYLT